MSTKLLNFFKPAIKRSVIPGRFTNIVSRYVYDPAYKPSALSYAFQSRRYLATSSNFNFSLKKQKEMKNEEKVNEKTECEDKKKADKKGKELIDLAFIFIIFLGKPSKVYLKEKLYLG